VRTGVEEMWKLYVHGKWTSLLGSRLCQLRQQTLRQQRPQRDQSQSRPHLPTTLPTTQLISRHGRHPPNLPLLGQRKLLPLRPPKRLPRQLRSRAPVLRLFFPPHPLLAPNFLEYSARRGDKSHPTVCEWAYAWVWGIGGA